MAKTLDRALQNTCTCLSNCAYAISAHNASYVAVENCIDVNKHAEDDVTNCRSDMHAKCMQCTVVARLRESLNSSPDRG